MTNKEYQAIIHDNKYVKITYFTEYSTGVMIIKESMWILRIKRFNKAFKDCTYDIEIYE
jgi:hypothetical protein